LALGFRKAVLAMADLIGYGAWQAYGHYYLPLLYSG
jgi:hypothetical protein